MIETLLALRGMVIIVLPMPKPFDAHDDQELSEIRTILGELPDDHAAWTAHKEGADAITLCSAAMLLTGRDGMV